jgi:hypothetical protein
MDRIEREVVVAAPMEQIKRADENIEGWILELDELRAYAERSAQ